METEVVGALIQAGGTILAAGLAVRAGSAALRSWKQDAPGRRSIEVAESCLVLVHRHVVATEEIKNIATFLADEEDRLRPVIA